MAISVQDRNGPINIQDPTSTSNIRNGRRGSSIIRVAVAATAVLLAASRGDADILATSASVRSSNSLIVDIQVTTGGSAGQVVVTYQAAGVDPLVSRLTPISTTGPT